MTGDLIARWTTPAVTFKPSVAEISDIVEIEMVVNQGGEVIRKGLDDATIVDDTYVWNFTQEESSKLTASRSAFVQIDYKTASGMRYTVYPPRKFNTVNSAVDEVI